MASSNDHLKGAPLLNAEKTHCKYGHEFTKENTIWKNADTFSGKMRVCRQCKSRRDEAARRRRGQKPKSVRKFFRVTRDDLRRLIDVVWNEATESTAVPSTNWADRLIDKALTLSGA
jgi:hypothetical protein